MTQPDCREIFLKETRHGPTDPNSCLSMEVDKISMGLEEGFILATRSLRSCMEIREKQFEIDDRVGEAEIRGHDASPHISSLIHEEREKVTAILI